MDLNQIFQLLKQISYGKSIKLIFSLKDGKKEKEIASELTCICEEIDYNKTFTDVETLLEDFKSHFIFPDLNEAEKKFLETGGKIHFVEPFIA